MRIYISGAITGQETTARKRFDKAAEYLGRMHPEAEMINPYLVGNAADCMAALERNEYMHICYALMDLCDAVYFIPGWENSLGCQQEKIYATNRSMKVIE